jgi:hypothetical protein
MLLIKVKGFCDHWSIDPPGLHFEHPQPSSRLCFEPLKPLNFYFNADPDPAFHSNADPDPASKNYADPCGSGSGSATLLTSLLVFLLFVSQYYIKSLLTLAEGRGE